MTLANKISIGYVNPVIIEITGITDSDGNPITLLDFSKVTTKFKSDERNSVDNPEDVVVASDSELRLFYGDTTETGQARWVISGTYSGEEYLITDYCFCNLERTEVC